MLHANHLFRRPVVRQYWLPDRTSSLAHSHEHRAPSWMDLLYDLVFVVTLSKLGSAFATIVNSPEGSGQATLNLFQLFIPIYFQWLQVLRCAHTKTSIALLHIVILLQMNNFLNRHDGEDVWSMLLVSVNLLLNMFIAINVKTCSVDHECVAVSSFLAGARLVISVS